MIKKWYQFLVRESFGLSPQLFDFIKSKSIDWREITDSLVDLQDIKDTSMTKYIHIVDENDHIINVELEEDKQYRLKYSITITYLTSMSGNFDQFTKIQDNLNTIITCIAEMVDRVKDLGLKVSSDKYKIEDLDSAHNLQSKSYQFHFEFVSDPINMVDLKKYYDDYLTSTKFTPEFNAGVKKLVERYKRENINLMQFLDTATPDEFDTIMVGFITEDDIYGIADYNITTKKFTIDEAEIEASIDWYREEYGFD